jgi:PAS domain-containing protein
VAAAAGVIASTLRFYINPLLGYQAPYVFHAVAVAIAAQYGGTAAGVVTTALSLVIMRVILSPPVADPRASTSAGLLGTAVVVCFGVFLSIYFGGRRRVEQELRDIRYHLEAAEYIAKVGSWETNLVTGALWWSSETRNIFAVQESAQLTREDFYQFVHPEDREELRQLADAAISSTSEYNVEHRIVRADGEIRYVHQIAKVICERNGAPILLIGTIQDITDRKRAEQEIRVLRGLLPICGYCRKIRDDDRSWLQLETYVKRHSEADFTHTICPECMERYHGSSGERFGS